MISVLQRVKNDTTTQPTVRNKDIIVRLWE